MQNTSQEMKNKCNFCGGTLITESVTKGEIKINIQVKKVKQHCQSCSMVFEIYQI